MLEPLAFIFSNNWQNSIQIKNNSSIFVYRRGCLLYHLSTEKLLVFENGRQYVIYSKKNEPRLSVVGAFICCLTFDCLNNIGLFVSIFVR